MAIAKVSVTMFQDSAGDLHQTWEKAQRAEIGRALDKHLSRAGWRREEINDLTGRVLRAPAAIAEALKEAGC